MSDRQTVMCKSCLRVKAAKTKNRGRENSLLPGRNSKQDQCVLLMGEEDEKDKEDIIIKFKCIRLCDASDRKS